MNEDEELEGWLELITTESDHVPELTKDDTGYYINCRDCQTNLVIQFENIQEAWVVEKEGVLTFSSCPHYGKTAHGTWVTKGDSRYEEILNRVLEYICNKYNTYTPQGRFKDIVDWDL